MCRASVCADMNQLLDWLTLQADSADMSVMCGVHLEDGRLRQTTGRTGDDEVVWPQILINFFEGA